MKTLRDCLQPPAYSLQPDFGWRIYKRPASGSGTLYMYGPSGQLLHEQSDNPATGYTPQADYAYFGGRLLYKMEEQSDTWTRTAVYTDRLGTVRARGTGTTLTRTSHYPFGEEIGTPSDNNTYKFASTYRDSSSGLDYAVNRYYASGMGRFLSADPYEASGGAAVPQNWNRYAYVHNDPVNYFDPMGTLEADPNSYSPPVIGGTNMGFYTGWPLAGNAEGSFTTFGTILGPVTGTVPSAPLAGGGGGAAALLRAAEARVKADLAKADCGADFKDLSAVLNKTDQIGLSSQGLPQFHSNADGSVAANRRSPGLGVYNWFTKSINLNSDINWSDPAHQSALLDGQSWTYSELAGQAAALGVASVNAAQLMELTILHELSHYKGAIGNPDKDPSVEGKLWKDCIQ